MCDILDYTRNYGLKDDEVRKCISKVALKVNVTEERVCKSVVMEMKRIEDECTLSDKITLKDYQLDAIRAILKQRGIVLGFKVGAGKTITAVGMAVCALRQAAFFGKKIRVVVAVPPSLEGNFRKGMADFGLSKTDKRFEITTVEKFKRQIKGGQSCKNVFLIIDEAHNLRKDYRGEFALIKGSDDGSTQAVQYIKCAKQAWKVVLLTGTPAYNAPYDILNLAAMARGEEPLTANQWESVISNDAKFRAYFCGWFKFYTPDRTEYPQVDDKITILTMPNDFLKKYEEMERTTAGGKKSGERSNAFYSKLRQKSNSIMPNLKIDATISLIKKGQKTIVYSEYIDSGIQIIKDRLDDEGIDYRVISSETKQNARQDLVNQYNEGEFNVLLITKAGREGLDLKETRNVVILEPGWNLSTNEQVIGRAARFRSHANLPEDERWVNVYNLVLVKPNDVKYLRDLAMHDFCVRGIENTRSWSADMVMYVNARRKQCEIDALIKRIEDC